MRLRQVAGLIAATVALFLDAAGARGQAVSTDGCTVSQRSESITKGDLDAANAANQRCIDARRSELTDLIRQFAGKSAVILDVLGLAEANLGSLFCAKIEILAMMRARPAADSAVAEAEQFEAQYPKSAMSWGIAGACLPRGRAFVLEMSGDLDRAATAYEAILNDSVNAAWSRTGAFQAVYGRLALIALQRGDLARAERWAKMALADDPTSQVVWALLQEHKGNSDDARSAYAAAARLLDGAKSENLSPMFFAELSRVKVAR